MRRNHFVLTALTLVVLMSSFTQTCVRAQTEKALYPVMAPLAQYLIADENAEIALARSAAPTSVSNGAEVMVLKRDGYTTAVKGSNGFVCIVLRSWATTTNDPQFWNPKIRAPHCFNAAAASSVLPFFLTKSKLVLAGKSQAEIAAALASAQDKKEIPQLAPGTLVYMMSKQQYLNDAGKSWHPHVMFYAAGDAEKSWGANLPGSPVMSVYDPEQHVTTFFVLADKWSDGTPGPPREQ